MLDILVTPVLLPPGIYTRCMYEKSDKTIFCFSIVSPDGSLSTWCIKSKILTYLLLKAGILSPNLYLRLFALQRLTCFCPSTFFFLSIISKTEHRYRTLRYCSIVAREISCNSSHQIYFTTHHLHLLDVYTYEKY